MATFNTTYNQISNPSFNCWGGNNMDIEQVRPNGIINDYKHSEKSVRLRLKDDIVQEIDY